MVIFDIIDQKEQSVRITKIKIEVKCGGIGEERRRMDRAIRNIGWFGYSKYW
jgi:hypothetical protein